MVSGVVSGRSRDARPRHRSRVRYAFREFLQVPLWVLGAFVVLATVAVTIDRSSAGWSQPVTSVLTAVVSAQSTSALLQTVTPGLLTVVSIIFFVLLMAVQHQSSVYSPVVLDQFLRRKGNQVFFGTFVGLVVYCVLVLGLVPSGQAVASATLALVLSVVTFGLLVVFVYNTVDQMRPSAAMWQLQLLAVNALASQRTLLDRAHPSAELDRVPATQVRAERTGYIVEIDDDALAAALVHSPIQSEIEVQAAMGAHLVPGSRLAVVRCSDPKTRAQLAETVLEAITVGRMRDIDRDPAHAVEHLSSIAWSATAVAGDPEGARTAVETLHSLLISRQREDRSRAETPESIRLVYDDGFATKIMDAFTSVIVATGHSRQHQTCAHVLMTLSDALPQLEAEHQTVALDRLQRVLPISTRHPYTHEMEAAFDAMHATVANAGYAYDARRLQELKSQLATEHDLASPETPEEQEIG